MKVQKFVVLIVVFVITMLVASNMFLFTHTDYYQNPNLFSDIHNKIFKKAFLQGQNKWPREKIGPHGWILLHVAAARLPFDLSQEEQDRFKIFLNLLYFIYNSANFYPCKLCGEHFLTLLQENPPIVETREQGILYMCKMHNLVNKRLNKTQIPCGTNLFELYGGNEDCGCGTFKIIPFQSSENDHANASNSTFDNSKTSNLMDLQTLKFQQENTINRDSSQDHHDQNDHRNKTNRINSICFNCTKSDNDSLKENMRAQYNMTQEEIDNSDCKHTKENHKSDLNNITQAYINSTNNSIFKNIQIQFHSNQNQEDQNQILNNFITLSIDQIQNSKMSKLDQLFQNQSPLLLKNQLRFKQIILNPKSLQQNDNKKDDKNLEIQLNKTIFNFSNSNNQEPIKKKITDKNNTLQDMDNIINHHKQKLSADQNNTLQDIKNADNHQSMQKQRADKYIMNQVNNEQIENNSIQQKKKKNQDNYINKQDNNLLNNTILTFKSDQKTKNLQTNQDPLIENDDILDYIHSKTITSEIQISNQTLSNQNNSAQNISSSIQVENQDIINTQQNVTHTIAMQNVLTPMI